MATYTIGIPTYNRLQFLQQSLASALQQIDVELEVVVCDNASTDGTQQYLHEQSSDLRIRYVRNPTNVGALANFKKCVEHANGEFFSWLQDDDLIFRDFANVTSRALNNDEADLALTTAIYTENPTFIYWDSLYSPPLRLNWVTRESSIVSYDLMLPMSLICSVAIPPVITFRSKLLKAIIAELPEDSPPLFLERYILVEAARRSRVIAIPYVSGIFRAHASQSHVMMMKSRDEVENQWIQFSQSLSKTEESTRFDRQIFRDFCLNVPSKTIKKFYSEIKSRRNANALAAFVCSVLEAELENRGEVVSEFRPDRSAKLSSGIKKFVQPAIPPVIWSILGTVCRRVYNR